MAKARRKRSKAARKMVALADVLAVLEREADRERDPAADRAADGLYHDAFLAHEWNCAFRDAMTLLERMS